MHGLVTAYPTDKMGKPNSIGGTGNHTDSGFGGYEDTLYSFNLCTPSHRWYSPECLRTPNSLILDEQQSFWLHKFDTYIP